MIDLAVPKLREGSYFPTGKAVVRCYMSAHALAKARLEMIDGEAVEGGEVSSQRRADGQDDAVALP
jgi:hypothetical protein